jgi:hypothetical protein
MDIPQEYIIHDTRVAKDFQGITICGYKRKDVLNAFQNAMINNKLEDAMRWLVELHSTGLNNQIWTTLKNIYFKYIHINNPKYLFYLLKREKTYLHILNNYPKKHEIFTRNDQEIRNLLCELSAISVLTKKNNLFLPKSLPTINAKSFQKEEIHKRMISKDVDKIIDFIFPKTSNEEKLGLNEIINNLTSKKGTFQNCIYWYLWLEKMESSKKKDKILLPESDDKYKSHWIFILWEIILSFQSKLDKNNLIFLKKLHHIYKKNFKPSDISKKKYYIFISFYIFFHEINWNINIFQQEFLIIQTNANINKMYRDVIANIERNISEETKKLLYKEYYKLYNKFNDISTQTTILKKVKNPNLDEEINKVLFTEYPEFNELRDNSEIQVTTNNIRSQKTLISKNKTHRDVENEKELRENKKLEVFTNLIAYKKDKSENNNKPKNVLEYYNDDNNIIYKNINFDKRK